MMSKHTPELPWRYVGRTDNTTNNDFMAASDEYALHEEIVAALNARSRARGVIGMRADVVAQRPNARTLIECRKAYADQATQLDATRKALTLAREALVEHGYRAHQTGANIVPMAHQGKIGGDHAAQLRWCAAAGCLEYAAQIAAIDAALKGEAKR